jgi:glycine cleavage system aminomethyltransferase T/glycine/D-amino acid oxidase-like deaminating enzyme
MTSAVPTDARVVIVGGGVIGCSLAYHLGELGWKDVVVLEQNEIAAGTTWHAAGLVGRLRTSNSLTKINKYSAELYARLEADTGHSIGWKQVGSLILAKSETRMTQLRRTAAMAAWFDVDVHLISPQEAQDKWPLVQVEDILGAAWLPHDGKCIPKELAIALARGAEQRGARVITGIEVQNVLQKGGRAVGVEVCDRRTGSEKTRQSIRADFVVLCGGMWTRELGLRCGVTLPLYPVEHHWILSELLPEAFDELPVGRDPDLGLYFRGEGKQVMLGAFQAESKAWMVDEIPRDFAFQLLEPDWERFSEPLRHGKWRIPALRSCRFDKFTNGPESFTPDNNFLMGETPELKNLFVGAGFNSVGIASAGGAGKYLAEWIVEGQPSLDLWSVDVRRFGSWANNREYLRARVIEVLGLHYQPAWPNREPETARDIRLSPIHASLKQAGACFGVKNGWERPNWFARSETPRGVSVPPDALPYAREAKTDYAFERQNWFANHAAEHLACRQSVAIFDQSAFGKLSVEGKDSVSLMQRVCAANIDVPVGKLVYTAMLNRRGGFESDCTVLRQGPEQFYVITGTAQPRHDSDWIARHRAPNEQLTITDVTSAYGVLSVMGPKSRELLQSLSDMDMSHAAFPFGTAKEIAVGCGTALALRVTYVGELGWELHISTELMPTVFAALLSRLDRFDGVLAGHYAINSLRLEKGYRAWGADISPDDNPIEAGLMFAVDASKSDFIGRDVLMALKEQPRKRQLVSFVLEDPKPMLWGAEPIFHRGRMVGYTSSGSYGHTLGGGVALGYINAREENVPDMLKAGGFSLEVNGARVDARGTTRPPFDPERKRILS